MSRRSRPAAARAGNHGLEQRLLQAWRSVEADVPSGPIVLGFSGGADSLALAIALGRTSPLFRREIVLLHVDHGLRPESADEAETAVRLASALNLAIVVEGVEPERLRRHRGVGREERARRERYVVAQRFAAGIDGVFATAHHADDQAETVLLHLFRGSGLDGVSGMRPLSRMTVPWWPIDDRPVVGEVVVWRPLLSERRVTLAAYRGERRPDLTPTEDASNADQSLRRNAVRAKLLPEIEQVFPGASEALVRFARLARADADLLDELATKSTNLVMRPDGSLVIPDLISLPWALSGRVVRRWVGMTHPALELPGERVNAVLGLAEGAARAGVVEIGQNARIVRSDRYLLLESSPR